MSHYFILLTSSDPEEVRKYCNLGLIVVQPQTTKLLEIFMAVVHLIDLILVLLKSYLNQRSECTYMYNIYRNIHLVSVNKPAQNLNIIRDCRM